MADETSTQEAGTRSTEDIGLIEKAFLLGLGAAVMTRDKVNELAEELVRKGQVSQGEARSFASELAGKADRTAAAATHTIAEESGKVIARMGLATRQDIERIEAELTELKAMIASMRPAEGGAE